MRTTLLAAALVLTGCATPDHPPPSEACLAAVEASNRALAEVPVLLDLVQRAYVAGANGSNVTSVDRDLQATADRLNEAEVANQRAMEECQP